MATSKHGRIHTHLRNAVGLVWGSLRLAATTTSSMQERKGERVNLKYSFVVCKKGMEVKV